MAALSGVQGRASKPRASKPLAWHSAIPTHDLTLPVAAAPCAPDTDRRLGATRSATTMPRRLTTRSARDRPREAVGALGRHGRAGRVEAGRAGPARLRGGDVLVGEGATRNKARVIFSRGEATRDPYARGVPRRASTSTDLGRHEAELGGLEGEMAPIVSERAHFGSPAAHS